MPVPRPNPPNPADAAQREFVREFFSVQFALLHHKHLRPQDRIFGCHPPHRRQRGWRVVLPVRSFTQPVRR